jgi:uncharacterized protein (DUF983 family)
MSPSLVTVIPASCPKTYPGTLYTYTITFRPDCVACAASGLTIINNVSAILTPAGPGGPG